MGTADFAHLGRQRQEAGDLRGAEHAYRNALQQDPACFDVWQALAGLLQGRGQWDEAASAYEKAIQLKPDFAPAYNSLGILRARLQDLAAAEKCFRRACELVPDFAQAHNNLGNVYKEQGRRELARTCYQEAIRIRPDFADAHSNLGNVLRELGQPAEGVQSCRRAIELKPDHAAAHSNLGLALLDQKQAAEAIASFQAAVRLRPQSAAFHHHLGMALAETGRTDEALAEYREAVRVDPGQGDAQASLGTALLQQARLQEAIPVLRRALALRPECPATLCNLGLALADSGELDEALALYEKALRLKPDHPETHKNRSLVWLLQGRFEEGWAEYEWRWQCKELPARDFAQPLWDGRPLEGRTILLHAEQGLGDTLQFIRYAALVKARGGKVIVAAQRPLLPLLRSCPGIDRLLPQGEPLPAFDVHAPLLSLPRIFGTDAGSIPAPVPYLHAEPERRERWRRELAFGMRKIGIAWQGSGQFRLDSQRSIPLLEFAPVARVPGVQLYSLQKGPGQEQIARAIEHFPLIDLGSRLDEGTGAFLDTAAVMKSLDLVISCNSALAHLAGALGVPSWVALPKVPDWRWLLERRDCPWYPSARLFRQTQAGEWPAVFEHMARELSLGVATTYWTIT
jgi:tetratricopeptide (TPR) repeat protein